MMCENQHGRPTPNLFDGKLERMKRMKKQGSTDGMPAKALSMLLSVISKNSTGR
jgi:hypothetical protein